MASRSIVKDDLGKVFYDRRRGEVCAAIRAVCHACKRRVIEIGSFEPTADKAVTSLINHLDYWGWTADDNGLRCPACNGKDRIDRSADRP